jgi:hypothetical protein
MNNEWAANNQQQQSTGTWTWTLDLGPAALKADPELFVSLNLEKRREIRFG